MSAVSSFTIGLEQVEGYEFKVTFDKPQFAEWITDEPAPLGKDVGPNPSRILAVAVANCLAASLTFCLSKRGTQVSGMKAQAHVELVRNADKRLRIGKVRVELVSGLGPESAEALAACLPTFEDFCVVTQSVREGFPIEVSVS